MRPGTARTWPAPGGTEDLSEARADPDSGPGASENFQHLVEKRCGVAWGGLSLRSLVAREGTGKLSGHHLAWLLSIRAVPSLD